MTAGECPPEALSTQLLSYLHNLQMMDVIVGYGREGQEGEYRSLVIEWCSHNHLHLNIKKTKEMITDFKRTKTQVVVARVIG